MRKPVAAAICLALGAGLAACNAIFGVDDLSYLPNGTGGTGAGGSAASSSDASSSSSSGSGGGASGTGGSGGMGGMAGGGGAGGMPVAAIGCSDGTRELFMQVANYPTIAGCSGAWSVQGVASNASQQPQCNRMSGNDGAITNGQGCSVADLCDVGWHVCVDKQEVGMQTALGCVAAENVPGLWLVRSGGPTNTDDCSAVGPNNLFGCGSVIGALAAFNCAPLSRRLMHAECNNATNWSCGPNFYQTVETERVTKSGSDNGGVLCCAD